ncbi:MAG: hypothetical protein AB1538_07160, partial [Bacillota bacterium]
GIKTDKKILRKYIVVPKILLAYGFSPCYAWYWKIFTPNFGDNNELFACFFAICDISLTKRNFGCHLLILFI